MSSHTTLHITIIIGNPCIIESSPCIDQPRRRRTALLLFVLALLVRWCPWGASYARRGAEHLAARALPPPLLLRPVAVVGHGDDGPATTPSVRSADVATTNAPARVSTAELAGPVSPPPRVARYAQVCAILIAVSFAVLLARAYYASVLIKLRGTNRKRPDNT